MYAPGTVIGQKYWIERVLGEGGMGVVFAATHLQLGQRVALKFLRRESTPDAVQIERFLREARAVVRLKSEHVCRVVDVGTEEGAPYIVMEHLEGHDLASVIRQGGPVKVPTAVDYVLQACLALAEAHVAGIVHRDLKPSNLFLTRRPEGTPLIKVMDFGIAKAHGRMDARLTDSAAIMGSPSYMAPEQLKSARDVDARADVWSLGVVLFELVTARRPFDADSIAEIAAKVTLDPPAALPLSLPRGFAEVLLRCLEKDPARRYRSVGELAQALAGFGSPGAKSIATHAARVIAAAGTPRTDPLARVMGAVTQPRWSSLFGAEAATRRRRLVFGGVAVAAAAVMTAVAVLVMVGGSGGGGRVAAPDAAPVSVPVPVSVSVSVSAPVSAAVTATDAATATVSVTVSDAATVSVTATDAGMVPATDAAAGRDRTRDPRDRGKDPDAAPVREPGIDAGGGAATDEPIDRDGDGIPDIR